jgi:5-methyltetrahydrofolate--homocysteine methyltransferase
MLHAAARRAPRGCAIRENGGGMTIDQLRARTVRGPLVLDGAMGTFLHASAGAPGPVHATDALTWSHTERVRAAHDAYLDAGADIVRTNTFRAASEAHAAHARALCEAAARLARAAADEWSARTPGRARLVAGALGPADEPRASPARRSAAAAEELRGVFREPLIGLLTGGVDLLLFETWWCPAQTAMALAALADAHAATGRRVAVLFSAPLAPDGRVAASHAGLEEWLAEVDPEAVDGVGVNCGHGPGGLAVPLSTLAGRFPLVLCAPSAGVPGQEGTLYSPAGFARSVSAYVAAGIVQIAGGCCGTTPEHVRALAEALEAPAGQSATPPNAVATPRRAGTQ